MKQRIRQVAMLCALGFVIGTGAAWYQVTTSGPDGAAMARIEPAAGQGIAGAEIGGPFTLVDQDGKTVTDKDYQGEYKLIYFGFTYCPSICPTELQKVSAVMNGLGDSAQKLRPIFITTDPERDTPEVMKQYVEMFHPRMVGLTGSLEQIAAAEKAYKVYAAKTDDDLNGYTMNHSAYTFFMGPEGEALAMFSTDDQPAEIINTVKRFIDQGAI